MSYPNIQTGWPDAGDVMSYCRSVNISPDNQSSQVILRAALAAVAEFERRVRWQPFLSADTVETPSSRFFDPPTETRFISLGAGLVSLTSLSTGVGADGTGGTVQTQNQYFRLLPVDAPARGRPYEVVEFLSSGYGVPGGYSSGYGGFGSNPFGPFGRAQSIKITGAWGFCLAVPDDVKEAVIARGLAKSIRIAAAKQAGVVKSVEMDGSTVTFNPAPHAALIDSLNGEFEDAVTTHTHQPQYL